jgi:AcrR family transcriptional regulator
MTNTAARRPNRRGEGGKLRDDILAAAAGLIEETGSEQAVTLREVARRIGIAAPSIYEHFPNRDAIVDAVIDAGFAELQTSLTRAMEGEADPLSRLRAGCIAYLRFAARRPSEYRILFGRRSRIRVRLTPLRTHALGALVAALRDCAAAGQCVSSDPDADALMVWAALHGYALLRASWPSLGWPAPGGAVDQILSGYTSAAGP